jgi:hypothetical protein
MTRRYWKRVGGTLLEEYLLAACTSAFFHAYIWWGWTPKRASSWATVASSRNAANATLGLESGIVLASTY